MSDERKVLLTTGGAVPEDYSHTAIGPDGQQAGYIVLSPEERAKGFVRPVRQVYVHVGKRPAYPLRDLTPQEQKMHAGSDYAKFEIYPTITHPVTGTTLPADGKKVGRFWSEKELRSGCNTETRMGLSLAETYARDPKFYGGTFCAHCRNHFDVGADGEFVWAGTSERVGT